VLRSAFARAALGLASMPDTDSQTDQLFYDGTCGLCHRTVQFAMKHDAAGTAFRFAPLQGGTFQALIDPARRARIPDSLVVLTSSGEVLVRSDAALRVLEQVGGGWRTLGKAIGVVPRPIRDAAYNAVAAVRYRIFGRKDDLCPLMTPDERRRFDP
jgi:predicted DCC family thiol-disulfide oxidoreductase YuxK